MRANRDQALKWIAASEGGYVDHPDDPGGATNYGVTQAVYDAWKRKRGEPTEHVVNITKAVADKIFVLQYFDPVRFDELPSGLDYAMADYSVNSGPGRAVRDLQRTLNDNGHALTVDGHLGELTLAAVMQSAYAGDLVGVIHDLCHRRMRFLKRLRHWKTFGKGWQRRVMGEQWDAQDTDTGVIDRATRMATYAPPPTYDPQEGGGKGTRPHRTFIQRWLWPNE